MQTHRASFFCTKTLILEEVCVEAAIKGKDK